jgi:hypothetical protein
MRSGGRRERPRRPLTTTARPCPPGSPVAKRPESAMLLHHLGVMHPAEAGHYLKRMEREKIDAVLMEVYELVEGEV